MARRSRQARRTARARAREWAGAGPGDGTDAPAAGEAPLAGETTSAGGTDLPLCPLCERPIPPHARQSVHHLVPKLKGGAKGPTALVHQICHNEIHAALSEAELARLYDTPEKLRAHPRLARFVAWIADKDPAFHSRTVRRVGRR